MGLGQDLLSLASSLQHLDTSIDGDIADYRHGKRTVGHAADRTEVWWKGPQADDARTVLREYSGASKDAKRTLVGLKEAVSDLRRDAREIGNELVPLEQRQTTLAIQAGVYSIPQVVAADAEAADQHAADVDEVAHAIAELEFRWQQARRNHDEVLIGAANALAVVVPPPADFQVGGVPMPTGDALDALATMVVDGDELSDAELVALRDWFDTLDLTDVEDWEDVFPDLAAAMKVHVLTPGLVLSSETEEVEIEVGKEIKKVGLKLGVSGSTTLQELGNGDYRVILDLEGEASANLVKALKIPLKVGLDGSVSLGYTFDTEAEARAFRAAFVDALKAVPNPLDYVQNPVDDTADDIRGVLGSIADGDVSGVIENGLDLTQPGVVDTHGMNMDYFGGIASVLTGTDGALTSATGQGGSTAGLDVEVSGVDLRSSAEYDAVSGRMTQSLSADGWVNTSGGLHGLSPVNAAASGGWEVQVEGEPGEIPDTATLSVSVDGEVSGPFESILPEDLADAAKSQYIKSTDTYGANVEVQVSIPTDRIDDVVKAMAGQGDMSDLRDIVEDSSVQITATTSDSHSDTVDLHVAKASVTEGSTENQFALVKPEGDTEFHRVN